MLKAPPANPRDYISRTFKKVRERGINMFKNMFKNRKKVDNGLFPIKKVNKDATLKLLYQRMGESHLHCCKPRCYFLSPEQTSSLIGSKKIRDKPRA